VLISVFQILLGSSSIEIPFDFSSGFKSRFDFGKQVYTINPDDNKDSKPQITTGALYFLRHSNPEGIFCL